MGELDRRSRQDEQMDAPDLDPAVYARVLHDLARLNRWTLNTRPVLAFLDRAGGCGWAVGARGRAGGRAPGGPPAAVSRWS